MADNAWKLTIRRDGSFYCYRCGDKGNWYQLKQRISGGRGVQVSGFSSSNMSVPKSNHSPYPSSREALGYDDDIDNEIEVLHSNIRNAQVQNKKKEIVLPNQRDAFGYHLDLTAAIYGNNAQSYSEQAAAARKELEKLEKKALAAAGKGSSVEAQAAVKEFVALAKIEELDMKPGSYFNAKSPCDRAGLQCGYQYEGYLGSVSYTHLTLPTICSV